MVKRGKSPDIADEARYFTVFQPYPINKDSWKDEEVQRVCAAWVAECIGPQYLWAMHTKPTARGMILLEVSRSFEDHAKLLGEHRWNEFLQDPTEEEMVRFTQVFHSFYSRGREAQKDGWKAVVVNGNWFENWAPGKDRFVHPYPATHWCAVPSEDKTQKTLCRPLPAEQKLPPPRSQPVVVGSSNWVAKQSEAPPTKTALAKAWSQGGTPTRTPTPLLTETERTSSGASSPSIQPTSPLSPAVSVPASPAPKGKPVWGRTMPLQKFVKENVRSNVKIPGWGPLKPTASPVGAKSPLAEESPKEPANAWTKPLLVPVSQRAKPAPPIRNESKWEPPEPDHSAWMIQSTSKDKYKNSNLLEAPSSSAWGAPPPSPRKGRNQERKDIGGNRTSSPRSDRPRTESSLPRDSTSRTRGGPSSPDTTNVHERKSRWDVPPPEQSTKHLPKPWDKKKKEKETIEMIDFGAPPDWSSNAPDTNTMEVDSEGRIKWGDSNPKEASERRYKATESSGSSSKYHRKRADHQQGSGEGGSKDGKKSFSRGEPRIRMDDRIPGRSAGRWDHGGYEELKSTPKVIVKKFNDAKGKQRNNAGKSPSEKKGGKRTDQEIVESMFSDFGMNDSVHSPTGMVVNMEIDTAPASVPTVSETLLGERGPGPTEDKGKEFSPIQTVGKWDPSPPSTENDKPDDFHEWGHTPHKKRLAALKRAEDNKEGGQIERNGKDVDMDKVSMILAADDQSASPAEVDASAGLKPWFGSSTSDHKQQQQESRTLICNPVANSSTSQGDNVYGSKAENLGLAPVPMDTVKDSASMRHDAEDWGMDSQELAGKDKSKAKAILPDDIGTRAEDWGVDPEPENSAAQPWRSTKHFKDDSVNWGAPQGNLAEWGLAPDLLVSTDENLNETEFYAWEMDDPAQSEAAEAPPIILSNKYLKTLKCPTHNYYCKKSICKDMARLVKEEEYKARLGIPSSGQGFKDHVLNEYRKPPTRPRGSKRGPRVRHRREPSTIGQLRGFKSDESDTENKPEQGSVQGKGKGKQKREQEDQGSHNVGGSDEMESKVKAEEDEPVASSSNLDATNAWGVPIGSNLDEWGVQTSLDAWMS